MVLLDLHVGGVVDVTGIQTGIVGANVIQEGRVLIRLAIYLTAFQLHILSLWRSVFVHFQHLLFT